MRHEEKRAAPKCPEAALPTARVTFLGSCPAPGSHTAGTSGLGTTATDGTPSPPPGGAHLHPAPSWASWLLCLHARGGWHGQRLLVFSRGMRGADPRAQHGAHLSPQPLARDSLFTRGQSTAQHPPGTASPALCCLHSRGCIPRRARPALLCAPSTAAAPIPWARPVLLCAPSAAGAPSPPV